MYMSRDCSSRARQAELFGPCFHRRLRLPRIEKDSYQLDQMMLCEVNMHDFKRAWGPGWGGWGGAGHGICKKLTDTMVTPKSF